MRIVNCKKCKKSFPPKDGQKLCADCRHLHLAHDKLAPSKNGQARRGGLEGEKPNPPEPETPPPKLRRFKAGIDGGEWP